MSDGREKRRTRTTWKKSKQRSSPRPETTPTIPGSPPNTGNGWVLNPKQTHTTLGRRSQLATARPTCEQANPSWSASGHPPFSQQRAVSPPKAAQACAWADLRRGNSSRGGLPPQYWVDDLALEDYVCGGWSLARLAPSLTGVNRYLHEAHHHTRPRCVFEGSGLP